MRKLAFFLAIAFLLCQTAYAQEQVIKVTSGQEVQVQVGPNQGITKLTFALMSSGNQPMGLGITASAPKDAVLKVSSAGVPQKFSLEKALESSRSSTPIEITTFGETGMKPSLTFGISGSGSDDGWNSAGTTVCNGMLEKKFVEYYTNLFSLVYQRQPNGISELCDYLFSDSWKNNGGGVGSSDTTTPKNSDLSAMGLLLKDRCATNLTYAVSASIDLSKISQELIANGFSVTVNLTLSKYSGADNMKLKAHGEGKFKGALAMGESMGGSFVSSEYHLMAKWNGGKITKKWKFPIRKYTPYRGMYLAVSTPGSALRGGKLSWYLTNQQSAYGVCVNATARDQLFNGYKN